MVLQAIVDGRVSDDEHGAPATSVFDTDAPQAPSPLHGLFFGSGQAGGARQAAVPAGAEKQTQPRGRKPSGLLAAAHVAAESQGAPMPQRAPIAPVRKSGEPVQRSTASVVDWLREKLTTNKPTSQGSLVKTPPVLIDYVICHELCHLKEMNHGPRFYALLDGLRPEWRQQRATLSATAYRYLLS